MPQYDAVIVGAGPNGLAAAIELARAGWSVIVYEAAPTAGGGARSAELTLPGYIHDVCSAIHPLGVASPFFRSLPLADYGVEWIHPDLPLAHPLVRADLLAAAASCFMNIRPETPRDYAAIGDLHVRAFGRTEEAVIVPLLRQRREFDPELSLVAEDNGKLVGHALFSPYPNMILMNDNIRAVNLAPIGIEPNYQKQGIGGKLIIEGHRIAQSKGYSVSFLLGHDNYYPRFDYKIGAYGASSVELIRENLISSDLSLETRTPTQPDCLSLSGLMIHEEYRVDFATVLSDSLLDWISPNPNIQSTVYLRDRAVVGYTRVHKDEPDKPRMFLAFDNKTAHAMTSMLMGDLPSITLPLHPYSRSAEAFNVKPQVTAWNAAMAYSLAPNPFDDYYAQLQEGKRLPGRVIWPVAFDLA